MTFMDITLPDAEMQQVVFSDVTWEEYERTLRELGDRLIYITYDSGRMEMMAPLADHEFYKRGIAQLIDVITEELDIPTVMLGSTTFKRDDLHKGLEPDECYYIGHWAKVIGKKRVDLRTDPPPDLVVEVDISHHALDRETIYAAMGVPEIWRFDGKRISALMLRGNVYEAGEESRFFKGLRMTELLPFVKMFAAKDATSVRKEFRKWWRQRGK